jgi:hypothetical protein
MNVLLEQSWTDRSGVRHEPGESVDVDTVTLAQLESSGVVTAPEGENLPRARDELAGPWTDAAENDA